MVVRVVVVVVDIVIVPAAAVAVAVALRGGSRRVPGTGSFTLHSSDHDLIPQLFWDKHFLTTSKRQKRR